MLALLFLLTYLPPCPASLPQQLGDLSSRLASLEQVVGAMSQLLARAHQEVKKELKEELREQLMEEMEEELRKKLLETELRGRENQKRHQVVSLKVLVPYCSLRTCFVDHNCFKVFFSYYGHCNL